MTRRRRIAWVAAILVIAALLVPAVAVAAPDSTPAVQTPNSALSWTNVRDSYGVPLSSYAFVTTDPGILNPLDTMLAFVLKVTFMVWLVIVTLAIWLIVYALSFGWLDLFADVLLGTANLFAGQVATTIVLIAAATLGAFFVGYFVVRGFYAKATMQAVTMIGVAVFGVIFLANPLADLLGPDGLLAKGRDVGVSIAAGLFGNSNPDPDSMVATMQASLADNFARKPLQVWNFGHVIDDQCGSAWSSIMMSGNGDYAKSALEACDPAAYAMVEEPSFSQVGAGLVLFICGIVLVWFAIRLGLRIIRAAMNAVYHGFMSIFGFAAGGYIYGPTQTFLIRNLVDTAFASFAMAAYTVFLAIYVLILGDVFQQVPGQLMQVFVVSSIVMVIGSRQLNNLRASLESGGEWVANRFAHATQAFTGGGAGGGGPVQGIGVGGGAAAAGGGLKLLAGIGAANALATFASNPLLRMAYLQPKWLAKSAAGWQLQWQENLAHTRESKDGLVHAILARRGWKKKGDPVTGRQLATLVNNWVDLKLPPAELGPAVLNVAGRDAANRMGAYLAAKGMIDKVRDPNAPPLAASAWSGVDTFVRRLNAKPAYYKPEDAQSTFEMAGRAIRDMRLNINEPSGPLTDPEDIKAYDTITKNMGSYQQLYQIVQAHPGGELDFWQGMSTDVRRTIGVEAARRLRWAHRGLRDEIKRYGDPDDPKTWADPSALLADSRLQAKYRALVDASEAARNVHLAAKAFDTRVGVYNA